MSTRPPFTPRTLGRFAALLPYAFRERFGDEMSEQIARDYATARSAGRTHAVAFAIATTLDLIRTAIAERLNPSWVNATPPATRRGVMWSFNEWMRDLRHAARALRRTPGFTATVVGTLGLAIGVNAGMFSVVDTVLLNPFPFANVDRLVTVNSTAPGSDLPAQFGVSSEFYLNYKDNSKLLEDVMVFAGGTSTFRVEDRAERIAMAWPTRTMYSTLGVRPILGRIPNEDEDDRVAVISYALWTTWFGNDSSVIGKSYYMSGADRMVVGVMGPEFQFPSEQTMLWIGTPIRLEGLQPGRFNLAMVARMKAGTTKEAVAAELTALSKRFPATYGGPPRYARLMQQHRAVITPLKDQIVGGVARPLWVLLGAVGLVLLIACANVANLFLVRAEGRQRELAVRRAIGAARSQLVRLQMSESLVVAGLAGVIAVVLAVVTLPAFIQAAPAGIPRLSQAGLSWSMLGFTLLAATISALVCGAIPAIRGSAPDLTRLREGGRGSTRKRNWARDGLVIGQTALALVLLIGSGLLVRSFEKLRRVEPGYSTENIFTFQFAPQNAALVNGSTWSRYHHDFMRKLRELPGVQSVGLVENLPLNEGTSGAGFRAEGSDDVEAVKTLRLTFAAGDYFKTMGVKVLAGREFIEADHAPGINNVVISQSAADAMWPGQNAVGKRLQQGGETWWANVIGVVDDVRQSDFRTAAERVVYFPLVGPTDSSWAIGTPAYVVKTPRAESIAPEIRAMIREMAPEAPMYRVFTMKELERVSMVGLSFTMLTLGVASVLALILGAVGLYGVLSYVVAERTREIGVRMALGARADQVRRMVVGQGARVLGIGVAIGIIAAALTTRFLGTMLFGVQPVDVATFVAMSLMMVGIGLFASYMPARRASNVDPIESLRGD
ncbi:MAG TPA: ABC transporter permease [Gemmatimonadaceae bacterium]|nr:ABC transporter permease [Gemmatimonadaceae bacterium]